MHTKLIPRLFSVALLLAALSPAVAQVIPSGRQGDSIPIVLGAAYSNFTMDWGPGHRSSGITAWADVYPFPGVVRNLGIEAEGRSSRWGNPIPKLREDTGLFGAIYSWRRFRGVRPYGKFLGGIGSMDFPPPKGFPYYTHDTYLVTAIAGGADIQAYQHVWIRADYQYQWWSGNLSYTPNGITIGAHWDFRRLSNTAQ